MNLALRFVLFGVLLAGLLFGCAGRWDLPFFWLWLAVPLTTALVIVRHMDPGLLKERMRPGQGGTDRALRIVVVPFWAAHLAIAGLDVGRFHWSGDVPPTLQIAALIIFAAAYGLSGWAVWVNRFYSPVVRIQSERDHVLVTSGPYRWVRHPGYTGVLLATPVGSVALGSWWSLVPLVPVLILLLRRTLVEDRFLHEHLTGYADYARRVRYRLLPGLW